MKVFSFCLYGTDSNYYTGLLENIAIIRESFPDFSIWVAKGICDPSWTLPPDVSVFETHREGAINALCRYLPMKTAEVGFARDADSRITERDQWCIRDFLASDFKYHMIRDHVWHRSRIMAGLFGWKQSYDLPFDMETMVGYGFDEAYLSEHLYPHIVDTLLVHTNIFAFTREIARRIVPPMRDPTDFVGNVIWNGAPKFTSHPDPINVIREARGNDQFRLALDIGDTLDPFSVSYDSRPEIYDALYSSAFYLNDIPRAQLWLSRFEFAQINSHISHNAEYLLPRLGKVVACFDSSVSPGDGEVFIYYGAYPDWHLALPCSNRIYRHISRFSQTSHDEVRYHPSWEPVTDIYIVTLAERRDRYYETLLTLAAVQAPLHRVRVYTAKKDGLPPYVGATKNHVDVLDQICESKGGVSLILEDDFQFIGDTQMVWSALERLWKEDPGYTLCFLSLSKLGRREPSSDLLGRSYQPCTTSSGYFVRKETVHTLRDTAAEGLRMMQETGDHHNYCIDRYWCRLPGIVWIRPKLGFQRPTYSNLLRTVSDHLD